MELHLKIIGFLLMLLAFIHLFFPGYFKWRIQLANLSMINRQMMYIHTFFIALVVFMMGLLCFTSAQEITGTSLGKKIALAFAVFWGIRLIIQFFGYSYKLWIGKKFETIIHIVFSLLWVYLSVVFLLVYIS